MTFKMNGPGTLTVRVYYGTATSSCLTDHAESGPLSASPYQVPGGVTPSQNNSLIVFGGATNDTGGPWTIDVGFTIQQQLPASSGAGGALADLIQTSAGNVSPTITFASPVSSSVTLAVFKPAAGSVGVKHKAKGIF
jgi:hypothetical protein